MNVILILSFCVGAVFGAGYPPPQPHTYKPPAKSCYQCAYSPPKTYYDQKVVYEKVQYGQQHQSNSGGYGGGNGAPSNGGGNYGGYVKKTYVPVSYTVNGGWDKCMGPFDDYQARHFGLDVWDCYSNCYVRRDPNGDVFRGCYKGEYHVDPNASGCTYQQGSVWCFCEGSKCNNGPAPQLPSH